MGVEHWGDGKHSGLKEPKRSCGRSLALSRNWKKVRVVVLWCLRWRWLYVETGSRQGSCRSGFVGQVEHLWFYPKDRACVIVIYSGQMDWGCAQLPTWMIVLLSSSSLKWTGIGVWPWCNDRNKVTFQDTFCRSSLMVTVFYQGCEKGMQSCRQIIHVDWISLQPQITSTHVQTSRKAEPDTVPAERWLWRQLFTQHLALTEPLFASSSLPLPGARSRQGV